MAPHWVEEQVCQHTLPEGATALQLWFPETPYPPPPPPRDEAQGLCWVIKKCQSWLWFLDGGEGGEGRGADADG